MKIYVIGPPGSGKTTLAKYLSKKNKIDYYELDLLVFDDKNNHNRRTNKEIMGMFQEILKKQDWIVEDVGRTKFQKALEKSDKIYYLKLSKFHILKRIIKRWIRQRRGIENYNYPPTYSQLVDMIKVAKSYFKKEKQKLNNLEKFNSKVIYLDTKKISKLYDSNK